MVVLSPQINVILWENRLDDCLKLLPSLLALAPARRVANPIAAVIKDISHASWGLHLIPYAIAFAVVDPIRGTKVIGTVIKVIRAVNEVVGTIVKVIGAVLKVVD